MTLSILNPAEYSHWDDLLLTSEQATFFHTSAWARVLSESYGYKPLYFSIVEGGKLTGLIPVMEIDSVFTGKRGVSLPFTDICHPIADRASVFKELLGTLTQHGKRAGWKHIEIRGGGDFLGASAPCCAEYITHILDLQSDENALQKTFRDSTRRNIRHAEKEGVEVTISHAPEALKSFYRLHCITRRRHGLPPQPWSFFQRIYGYVISLGKGFTALATYAGRIVAGAVYFLFRDWALFKFGASDRAYQHLRANNLVMWEAIRWLCRSGFRTLHYGRTESGNQGLKQFKDGWRAEEGRIAYYRLDLAENALSADRNGAISSCPVCRVLPIPVLRLAGSMLYRHVG